MPTPTKTFLLRAIASFAAVLIVNVLSANFWPGGLAVFVFDALRYGLVGAGAFFLVVAASTWGACSAIARLLRTRYITGDDGYTLARQDKRVSPTATML